MLYLVASVIIIVSEYTAIEILMCILSFNLIVFFNIKIGVLLKLFYLTEANIKYKNVKE